MISESRISHFEYEQKNEASQYSFHWVLFIYLVQSLSYPRSPARPPTHTQGRAENGFIHVVDFLPEKSSSLDSNKHRVKCTVFLGKDEVTLRQILSWEENNQRTKHYKNWVRNCKLKSVCWSQHIDVIIIKYNIKCQYASFIEKSKVKIKILSKFDKVIVLFLVFMELYKFHA